MTKHLMHRSLAISAHQVFRTALQQPQSVAEEDILWPKRWLECSGNRRAEPVSSLLKHVERREWSGSGVDSGRMVCVLRRERGEEEERYVASGRAREEWRECEECHYDSMYRMLRDQMVNYCVTVPPHQGGFTGIVSQRALPSHTEPLRSGSGPLERSESNEAEEPGKEGKPSPRQLEKIYQTLSDNLPRMFYDAMDYSIYTLDLVVENNIRGTTSVGLYNWVKQVALVRTVGHFKFAYVKMEVLKITSHPEDSTVKVRWRIRGISALKVMLNFWKYKLWKYQEILDSQELWYDGFSTFHVNGEGKVYRLVIDKMMPDTDVEKVKEKGAPFGAKVAILFGLLHPLEMD